MSKRISESDLEELFLDLLSKTGYSVKFGPDISPDGPRSCFNAIAYDYYFVEPEYGFYLILIGFYLSQSPRKGHILIRNSRRSLKARRYPQRKNLDSIDYPIK